MKIICCAILCLPACVWGLQYNLEEVLGTGGNDISFVQSEPGGFSPHPADSSLVAIEWPRSFNWFSTATVIAPEYIITVAHWKTVLKSDCPDWPLGFKLKRLGQATLGSEYIIIDERHNLGSDVMVCRVKKADAADPNILHDAGFADVIPLYAGGDEQGKTITFGSYSKVDKYNKTWCECTAEEKKSLMQHPRSPGTLHWGKNVIDHVISYPNRPPILSFSYDNPDGKAYIRYEACGTEGSSGSPWFIQDSAGKWHIAGMFTSCTTGPRISSLRLAIPAMINEMNTSPPADRTIKDRIKRADEVMEKLKNKNKK